MDDLKSLIKNGLINSIPSNEELRRIVKNNGEYVIASYKCEKPGYENVKCYLKLEYAYGRYYMINECIMIDRLPYNLQYAIKYILKCYDWGTRNEKLYDDFSYGITWYDDGGSTTYYFDDIKKIVNNAYK